MLSKLDDVNCPLYEYIGQGSNNSGGGRVKRTIIRAFLNLVVKLVAAGDSTATIFRFTVSNLLNRVNQSRGGGSEHFYNLPVVQICARALSRLTAHDQMAQLSEMTPQVNKTLIEIVTAFYRGSGGSTQSFMGKRYL